MTGLFRTTVVEISGVRTIAGGGTNASNAGQALLNLSGVSLTGNQTISGVKTFQNSIFYGLASGSFDLGLRTNISSGSGASVSFTRGGTIPSVHGYGIVFEGGSIANKKGYLTVGETVAPVGYQYASLDWTSRILSGAWSASSPIRVGSAVSVMTTGDQTISGVKTFATTVNFANGFPLYIPSKDAESTSLLGSDIADIDDFGTLLFIESGRSGLSSIYRSRYGATSGFGIVFGSYRGSGVSARKGYLTAFGGIRPTGLEYATLIWTDRILSGQWSTNQRLLVNNTGVLLSGEAVESNGTINKMIKLTQSQYNALSPVDPTTFYVIVG